MQSDDASKLSQMFCNSYNRKERCTIWMIDSSLLWLIILKSNVLFDFGEVATFLSALQISLLAPLIFHWYGCAHFCCLCKPYARKNIQKYALHRSRKNNTWITIYTHLIIVYIKISITDNICTERYFKHAIFSIVRKFWSERYKITFRIIISIQPCSECIKS